MNDIEKASRIRNSELAKSGLCNTPASTAHAASGFPAAIFAKRRIDRALPRWFQQRSRRAHAQATDPSSTGNAEEARLPNPIVAQLFRRIWRRDPHRSTYPSVLWASTGLQVSILGMGGYHLGTVGIQERRRITWSPKHSTMASIFSITPGSITRV